jgi:hypothetical protein
MCLHNLLHFSEVKTMHEVVYVVVWPGSLALRPDPNPDQIRTDPDPKHPFKKKNIIYISC